VGELALYECRAEVADGVAVRGGVLDRSEAGIEALQGSLVDDEIAGEAVEVLVEDGQVMGC
jgi:hypothetical protein